MASCVCTHMSMLRELYQQVLIEVPSVGSVVPICQRALGRTEMMAKPAGEPRPCTGNRSSLGSRDEAPLRDTERCRVGQRTSATCAVILSHCTFSAKPTEAHCLHTHLFWTLQILAALVCGDGSANGAKVDGTDAAFAPRRSHPAGMLLASCDAGMFGT